MAAIGGLNHGYGSLDVEDCVYVDQSDLADRVPDNVPVLYRILLHCSDVFRSNQG